MTLKALSPQERSDALEKAARARARRAAAKEQLRHGELGLAQLIKSAQEDEAIARMRVSELLEAVPGVGPVRAQAIMAEIGIAPSRRLRGLGIHQSRSLIDFMEDKYSV
ncbi:MULTISPECIES: integration host factor, actinobacterial type [Arthrobacter]|uniref:DNA-binding protein n=1 Tax=Arthrobacter terricola TaxID=2547396 RepID=A0A4V2ZT73_9MICC|nr:MULTISPECIES: integration host factor, actinobacterial type [Arthrobacter]MBT8161400.1 DNA-binding protein [Arthrobacter sp. GN70]TDF96014.1 DNA-binding protein [Arthrobacter terricola]